jgi:DNA polymerase III delta prime subunit
MFKRAERKQAKLRLAICGPSGSGKTYSALLIARGLVGPNGKIALIDTERGSGELYSDLTDYDIAQLSPPYSPQRYIEAIREAQNLEYDILIVDSLSHAWAGEGGALEMHETATEAQRSKNSYTAWRYVTPHHNRLIDYILSSRLHTICTIRSKTAYEIQEDGSTKTKPVKVGLAPIQKKDIEYEFTTVFDVSQQHVVSVSKDRSGVFDGMTFTPTVESGELFRTWLDSGALPPSPDNIPNQRVEEILLTLATTPLDSLRDTWPILQQEIRSLDRRAIPIAVLIKDAIKDGSQLVSQEEVGAVDHVPPILYGEVALYIKANGASHSGQAA